MLRVIVQARFAGEDRPRDLEVPAECPSRELAFRVSRAMGWNPLGVPFEIVAQPSREALSPGQSLAEAGLWDGSELLFRECPRPASTSTRGMAFLEVASGHAYKVTGVIAVIGRDRRRQRSDGSEIIDLSQEPQGPTVSREHAWLTLRSGQWRVAPSSRSRNPTMVNGQIVAPGSDVLLEDGDILKVGGVTLSFRAGSSSGISDSEQSESNIGQETP